jgi:NAD(P)-dependent dehydrogenase (short-subunit alcohol dehydrogenase family)
MRRLAGKVALVTGAGGRTGLGRSIALGFASEGANVAVTDIDIRSDSSPSNPDGNWNGIYSVAEEIQSKGVESLAVYGDARKVEDVERVVEKTLSHFGRIDVLVCNAAAPPGGDRKPIVDVSPADFNEVIGVNVQGTFLFCRATARSMIEKSSGKIIIMSSCLGKRGRANYAAYCASKFALIGFSESLALELAAYGITVNALCPGPIDTERFDAVAVHAAPDDMSPAERRKSIIDDRIRRTPLKRLGTPQDVANAATFLATDEADFLTGLALNVTGGFELAS